MNQITSLAESVAACTSCRLATDRSGLAVPAMPGSLYQLDGVAVFLEAPGADEEQLFTTLPSGVGIGKPLIGKAGQLMNQLLDIAGLPRDNILVLNRIRCRPPRNKIDNYPDAVSQCDPFVATELKNYSPSVVLLAGNTALKAIFGATASITAMRGSVRMTHEDHPYGKRAFIATFHPSYALRNGGLSSTIAADIISDIKLAKDLYASS